MDNKFFDRVFKKAGIRLELVNDVAALKECVRDVTDDVIRRHSSGNPDPTTPAGRQAILDEIAEKLVVELQRRYHDGKL